VNTRTRSGGRRALALILALSLAIVAACSGGDDDDDDATGNAPAEEGTPQAGGRVVYGLEAETDGGFCLPEAQLAISGILVTRSIYDTLTAPNADGEYVPYLAESVEPNADYTQWTIKLRDGITFHDGSPLTAEVVKNNLDAYRGQYKDAAGNLIRQPLLFLFVFQDIASVDVVDPLTVSVTTSRPWVSFPAYLFSSGRLGMAAQAQLDDAENCDENMIGTGPYQLEEWVRNDHLTVTKNPNYWRQDDDGNQLPYLDEIEFRPMPEAAQRLNALQAGEISMTHEDGGELIAQYRTAADAGQIGLVESVEQAEVVYMLLNTAAPPFDNILARQAVAYAIDYERLNSLRNQGLFQIADGPFAPGNVGYLDDTGFPTFDPDRARSLVEQYESETGQQLTFTASSTSDPGTIQSAQVVQQMLEDVGIETSLRSTDQATLINEALGGQYQAHVWRNHPGGDPDEQYVWWHTGMPTNFSKINDPEIDRLLDEGRVTADPTARQQIYEDLNRRFAEQVWDIWLWWPIWAIGTAPDVHGIYGPALPDGSDAPETLATGHPTVGLWVDSGS
jgi:peptide/nickel transport system substrate-binding protein